MLRAIPILVLAALALAPPAAGDRGACQRWTVDALWPGMPFDEAKRLQVFVEETKHRDPLGYRRYLYRSTSGPVRVGLHVDVAADPQTVIGITYEFPAESYDALARRFGKPVHSMVKGTYRIVSWWDDDCGVSVKVSTHQDDPQRVLGVSLSSNAGRSEYKRRKEAAAGEATADAPADG